MTSNTIFFLVGVGFFGGVWNAMASGATLFTFPALIFAGLPPVVANATNFLALLPSNAAALPVYRKELREVGPALWPILGASSAGAVLGALLLIQSDEALFLFLIPYLILGATLLFMFGNHVRRGFVRRFAHDGSVGKSISLTMLFVFSIYGGYFGAGVGIIILAMMQILGYSDFHVANGLKNLLATSLTVLGIIIFGISGVIAWPEATAMMAGSSAGGYLGGFFAKRVKEQYLRGLIIVFGLFLSGYYFISPA